MLLVSLRHIDIEQIRGYSKIEKISVNRDFFKLRGI
jgi:hypothetical protein